MFCLLTTITYRAKKGQEIDSDELEEEMEAFSSDPFGT